MLKSSNIGINIKLKKVLRSQYEVQTICSMILRFRRVTTSLVSFELKTQNLTGWSGDVFVCKFCGNYRMNKIIATRHLVFVIRLRIIFSCLRSLISSNIDPLSKVTPQPVSNFALIMNAPVRTILVWLNKIL